MQSITPLEAGTHGGIRTHTPWYLEPVPMPIRVHVQLNGALNTSRNLPLKYTALP